MSTFPSDLLHEFVLAAADSTPDHPAVVEQGPDGEPVSVSYGELASRTRDCAARLRGAGVGIGDRVVVESDTSASAVAVLAACSLLGAAFVPVSPEISEERLRSVVETVRPAMHLRADGAPRRAPVSGVGTAWFGQDGVVVEDAAPNGRPRVRHSVVSTDPAYVIFTSGTSGRPKGVVMSHRGALAFYRGAQRFGLADRTDRVASTSPLSFDVALFDIGVTLGIGATLVVVPRPALSFPRRLIGFLDRTGVTRVHGVPSMWRPLLRHEPAGVAGLTRLRGMMVTGESFPLPEVRQLRSLLPAARIVNAFGATETVAFSYADVPDPLPEGLEQLPIGRGFPGGELLLLDHSGTPVTHPGTVGEIHVRSPSIFTGYWDDPTATANVLVPDPLDPASGQLLYRSGDLAYADEHGELYFCGRADSMVKIRGNRVELGEVERQLTTHPAVSNAVALTIPDTDGQPTLVACVAPTPGTTRPTDTDLVALCRRALPAYMVPKRVLMVDSLPLTVNGKVDRDSLTELAMTSNGDDHPRTTRR